MRRFLKIALSVAGATAVAFVVLKMVYEPYMTREVIGLTIREGRKIEAFNDIGRLEAYDTLQDFLARGCIREAKQLVELQRSLLLSGLGQEMQENEDVKKVVLDRNAQVAERSRVEVLNRNPPRNVPRCQ